MVLRSTEDESEKFMIDHSETSGLLRSRIRWSDVLSMYEVLRSQ